MHRRAEPVAIGVLYDGEESAAPASGQIAALADPLLRGIVVAPSNPIVSTSPILAVAGLKEAIRARGIAVVAVSPLIAGKTVRGPAAWLLAELGYASGVAGLLSYYSEMIDGRVVDQRDRFPEKLSEGEAVTLISLGVDFGITHVADGNWGVHAIVRKKMFG